MTNQRRVILTIIITTSHPQTHMTPFPSVSASSTQNPKASSRWINAPPPPVQVTGTASTTWACTTSSPARPTTWPTRDPPLCLPATRRSPGSSLTSPSTSLSSKWESVYVCVWVCVRVWVEGDCWYEKTERRESKSGWVTKGTSKWESEGVPACLIEWVPVCLIEWVPY